MEDLLVPLGICVVMPVAIVWLVCYYRTRKAEKNAEVLLKAIEKGQEINPEMFAIANRRSNSLKIRLLRKLTVGIIFLLAGVCCFVWTAFGLLGGILLAIGITLIVMFFVGKKWLSAEIKAEEENL